MRQAVERGLDLIGICDHNSVENAMAVVEASELTDMVVIPGMEITSKEEVHILGMFGNLADAIQIQGLVYEHLEGQNDPEMFP